MGLTPARTASLTAAEELAERCSSKTPITPARRMATLRVSLHAIRNAATSIKPSFVRFYQALDQGQRTNRGFSLYTLQRQATQRPGVERQARLVHLRSDGWTSVRNRIALC